MPYSVQSSQSFDLTLLKRIVPMLNRVLTMLTRMMPRVLDIVQQLISIRFMSQLVGW
jgi:hypothetical protein